MAGLDSIEQESKDLWKKPTFTAADEYIRQLELKQRKKVIGYVDGEEIVVRMVGHVETHITRDDDDDFFGRCELAISGESVIQGFILGSFYMSGTALIIGQNDKLYAYSPEDAVDFPWKLMKSEGAEIEIDVDHNIVLRNIPRMIVASQAEW